MWIVSARRWKLVDLWLVLLVGEILFELYTPESYVDSVNLAWVEVSACMIVVVCNVGCGQLVGEME